MSNKGTVSGMIAISPEAALATIQRDSVLSDYMDYIATIWSTMGDIHGRLAEYILDLPDPMNERQWLLKSCVISASETLGTRKNSTCEEIAEIYFQGLLTPITRLKNLMITMNREDTNPDVDDEAVWDPIEESYASWRRRYARYDALSIDIVSTNVRFPNDSTLMKIIAAKLMSRQDAVAFGSRMI